MGDRARPVLRSGAALAAAAWMLALTTASAAPARAQISVLFLRGEQLATVSRPAGSAADAVRRLIGGPTRAEHSLGYRTYVPAGTRLLGIRVSHGLATVNLDERFLAGAEPDSRLARLSQLVGTLTRRHGIAKVQLLVDGKIVREGFPGVPTERPVTFRFLQTPNVPVPKPPPARLPAPDPAVRAVQKQLIALSYLLPGDDDGRFGPATSNAILAFQKWERIDRTGQIDSATKARIAAARHPAPLTKGGAGKRAEILLDRQVALLITNNRVVRTIAVSTGKASTPTPPGDYRVYAKIRRWWSTPFREWLPYALPFVGGIAFHEFGDVPAFPASHGCVRQLYTVARWTYAFAEVGMPVKVIATS